MKCILTRVKKTIGVLMCIIMFMQLLVPRVAVSADENMDFIKSVTLTDWDGNALTNNVELDSNVMLNFEFEVSKAMNLKENQEYDICVPSEIFISEFNMNIETKNGESIGTCVGDPSGKLKIKFSKLVSNGSNVTGNIKIKTRFNKDQLDCGGDKDLEFKLLTKTEKVHIGFQNDISKVIKPSITKEGEYDQDKNEINWTIKFDCGSKKLSNVIINDMLGENQSFIDNPVKVDNVQVNSDNYSVKDNVLEYKFDGEISGTKTIVVTTKPNSEIFIANEKSKEITNNVRLSATDIEPLTASSSVKVPTKVLNKTGKYIDNKRIEWTIEICNRENTSENVNVVDEIPAGQEYVSGTLKYDGSRNNEAVYDGDSISFSNDDTLRYEGGKVVFKGMPEKSIKIIFQTQIIDESIFMKNGKILVNNNAKLTFGTGLGSEDASSIIDTKCEVEVPGKLIEKSKGSVKYNPATRELTWNIVVDRHCIFLENPIVKDTINDDQILVEDSIVLDGENVSINGEDVSYDENVLTFKLPSGNSKHVIEYRTKVKSNTVYANNIFNKKFSDTASLYADNLEEPISAYAEQNVNSSVIEKKGSYDYSNNQINWTIIVNKNAMNIKNASVIDDISKEQEYIDNSFSIKDLNGNYIAENGFKYEKADSSDTKKTGTISYDFGEDEINSTYVIEFKTKIIDISFFSGDSSTNKEIIKKVNNIATLKGDILPNDIQTKGTCEIKIAPITKTSEYTTGSNYIKWSILMNENELDIGRATLVDNLNKYLKLDTSSIKLYKITSNKKDELPSKNDEREEVNIDSDQIEYINNYDGSNTLKVKVDDLNSAYLLEYVTYIDSDVITDGVSSIVNEAHFDGGLVSGNSAASADNIFFIEGSGVGSLEKGSISIKKLEDKTNVPLEGVVFAIYDAKYNILIEKAKTNEEGIVTFENIGYGVKYKVKQEEPLKGYIEDDIEKEYTISKEEKNMTYTWYAKPIVGKVQVVKQDADKSYMLSKAEFAVYKDEDCDNQPDSDNRVTTLIEDELINGIYSSELKYGKYVLKEEKAPEGYLKDDKYYHFEITEDMKTVNVNNSSSDNFINEVIKGKLNLKLVDASDKEKSLSSAKFAIYKDENCDNEPDSDAEVIILDEIELGEYQKQLEYGKYLLKEIEAPKGYVCDEEYHKFEINENGEIVNIDDNEIFTNSLIKGTVKIVKVDRDDYNLKLDGAEFEIYRDSNGNNVLDSEDLFVDSLSEPVDGVYTKSDLYYGSYFIKEKVAPKGYCTDSNYYAFNISENDKVVNVSNIGENVFVNRKIVGEVVVKIEDKDSDKAVKGVLVNVYNENGELVYQGITDSDGKINFNGVEGTYTYKIGDVPEEYNIDSKEGQVFVKGGEKVETIFNKIMKQKDYDNIQEKIKLVADESVEKESVEKTSDVIANDNITKLDKVKQAIKTGDNAKIGILIVIAIIALIVILSINISKRKNKI